MRYRRVAVFGASGFIGRYVVKRLAAKGCVVAAAGRDPEKAKLLRPMGDVGQVAPIKASITNEAQVAAALAGMDAAVNLVGILHGRGAYSFKAVHEEGAARVARLAAKAGVKHLVHISAIGASPDAASAYASTKGRGEEAVRQAFPTSVILRPSIVFGPEDHFFNRFAQMAQMSAILPLIGGGKTKFQPVYVGDVADAVIKALDEPGAAGHVFELGGPGTYTFRQLLEIMLAEIGRKRALLTLSYGLARFMASFMELLPDPPMTRDQVELLKHDNVVTSGMPGFAELGLSPTGMAAILPTYLDRYRRGGWFVAHGMEKPY
jgi:uncharacterized protein YbjT (DUF2867 family)